MIKDLKDFPKPLVDSIDVAQQLGDIKLNIVLPGDLITTDRGFMHGHGTFEENGKIFSNVVGVVEKTNKLILVNPIRAKYLGEIGDIVIGRVSEISNRRWLVDIGSHSHGSLNLNSINLPSGAQRRKTEEDELNMRSYFDENDILIAEIQSFNNDKSINLHTRNTKYGRLTNGICIEVDHKLIKRQKNHIIDLKNGIHIILGHNGRVWISAGTPSYSEETVAVPKIDANQREMVAKLRNCVKLLNEEFIDINIENITELYEIVVKQNMHAKDLLIKENKYLFNSLKEKLETKIPNELKKLSKQGNILELEN